MTLNDILTGGGLGVVILLTLVQVAPVKVDPWAVIGRWLGRAINGELMGKVDKLGEDLQSLKAECGEREAVSCRTRIIRFGDELRRGVPHSKEHFDQTLLDITAYEQYCNDHPEFANNVAVLTICHIKQIYAVRLERNDFL